MILGCGHDDDGDDDDGDDDDDEEEEDDDDDHCDGGDGDTAPLSPIFPWNKLICRGQPYQQEQLRQLQHHQDVKMEGYERYVYPVLAGDCCLEGTSFPNMFQHVP